jgi:hypothetical protein
VWGPERRPGFSLAGAYSVGKVVTEYGGGICQVSPPQPYYGPLAIWKLRSHLQLFRA